MSSVLSLTELTFSKHNSRYISARILVKDEIPIQGLVPGTIKNEVEVEHLLIKYRSITNSLSGAKLEKSFE